jgi:carbon storage regulator
MLIIARKRDEKIMIGDDIEIQILEIGRNRVRFGIKAPKHISVQTRQKSSAPVETAAIRAFHSQETDATEQFVPEMAGFSRRR